MPQNCDRNMTSKEANEKVPHFQVEGGGKYMIIYAAHLEGYFAITWSVFSLIQVKFVKKTEVAREKL